MKTFQNLEEIGQKVKEIENRVEHLDHFNHSDITRNNFMLQGGLSKQGYDWWWHSFTAHHSITGE